VSGRVAGVTLHCNRSSRQGNLPRAPANANPLPAVLIETNFSHPHIRCATSVDGLDGLPTWSVFKFNHAFAIDAFSSHGEKWMKPLQTKWYPG